MKFSFIFKTAVTSIARNKVRAFLTVLGVIIGVSSVILLTSIGDGLRRMVQDQFQSLGTNLVYVMPGDLFSKGKGFSEDSMRTGMLNSKFKTRDIISLNRLGYPIEKAVPITQLQQQARYQANTYTVTITGTSSYYQTIRNLNCSQGRFFTKAEETGRKKVVVIGDKVKDELFSKTNPVGKEITLGNAKFKIVGVVEKKGGGGMGGPDFDSWVYAPITTTQRVFDTNAINFIIVKVASEKDIPRAQKMVEHTLAKRLSDDDFSVVDQTELLNTVQGILQTMTLGLAGIAAISLIVGGIGIMNIMLVTVTERTKEIGLRKAVGATPRDILIQFLLESALLSSFGGIVGILIGSLGAFALNRFFPATPTPLSVAIAFLTSFVVGIVFGVFPAKKAASLSPIEAIRYE